MPCQWRGLLLASWNVIMVLQFDVTFPVRGVACLFGQKDRRFFYAPGGKYSTTVQFLYSSKYTANIGSSSPVSVSAME